MNFSIHRDAGRRSNLLILLTAMALAVGLITPVTAATAGEDVSVIVTLEEGSAADPGELVAAFGGSLEQPLDIINGFSAVVPSTQVSALLAHNSVASVVSDGSLEILEDGWDNATYMSESRVDDYSGSLESIAEVTIQADEFWDKGFYGKGVDVALIDSGVVPVAALEGRIINGPDLSFESQADDLRYLDTYGHGTHLAGIIAGYDKETGFRGIAPGSRIVNVKVADHEGAVDVSQVIAAIDWVVQHRNDNGMNIRVINLAYGTDSKQSPATDPLSYAVEQAWRAGIVVVVASGNDGNSSRLRNPALNPYIIAVGASDSRWTSSPKNDSVASFTSCGNGDRYIDVVAPGRSIISLRNPGSAADVDHPEARIGDDFFLGSGTSQASAVVSGAAALILSAYPKATPDQVKAALMSTGRAVATDNKYCAQGELINLETFPINFKEYASFDKLSSQRISVGSTGMGSLEDARGSHHVAVDGVRLTGEQDIFGRKWNAEYWVKYTTNHVAWDGGDWNGTSWSGTSWSGTSWSGTSWSGTSWSGTSWSDYVWSGTSWSGTSWSGTSWSGTSWSGTSWSGTSWSDSAWLGLSWGR